MQRDRTFLEVQNEPSGASQPPQQLMSTINELIDLARDQITYASRQEIPLNERMRLCRAARELLTAVLDKVDHVPDRGWVPLCEAVRNVLLEVKHGR